MTPALVGGFCLLAYQIFVGDRTPRALEPAQSPVCVTWEKYLAAVDARRRESGRGPTPAQAYYTGLFVGASSIPVSGVMDSTAILDLLSRARIEVATIICGSPAAEAGLRIGDEIVTINGRPRHQPGLLPSLQYPKAQGESFTIQIRRDGSSMTFRVPSVRTPPLPPQGRR